MKTVVIGAGTMGNGITHVMAQSGFSVTMVDVSREALDRGMGIINKNLARMVSKEKITENSKNETLGRITTATDLDEAVKDADLVVEAVNENFELKEKIFRQLDLNAPAGCILASNTSSISITKLGAVTGRAGRVIGMHFFNPVPVMKLVEVVRGLDTLDEVNDAVVEMSKKLGKEPVPVNDYPGFVSNRVLMPMINEAIFCVHEGVGTPENIDNVMKLGMAHPMGPLRLADFIGLDVCLDILNVLYEGFRDPKYRPCPLLVKMVDAGKLGDKTGQGFYTTA
ncbi:MAG: 3-hydroxybutyryl-CoA dehydrogenase [Balneolaceae bacterium]|nr:MAG: 3-hydroxybutyryl-CoA dehydrogenase [Balneolaceae bacterium]